MASVNIKFVLQGNLSELHAYLSTLPKSHNCLMGWSKAERSLFKGASPPPLNLEGFVWPTHERLTVADRMRCAPRSSVDTTL